MKDKVGRCLAARATHAPHRARILGLGLSVGIAIALAGCGPQLRDRPLPDATAQKHDEMVGYLVRLGYDRWVAACAYEKGLRHAPRAELRRDCVVDFASAGEAGTAGTTEIDPVHEHATAESRDAQKEQP